MTHPPKHMGVAKAVLAGPALEWAHTAGPTVVAAHRRRSDAGRSALAGAIIVFVLIVPALGFYGGALATRPPWLDEVQTLLLARQDTFGGLLRALASGAETNAPLLFAWYWLVDKLVGGITPVGMRWTSVTSTWIALFIVFRLLRPSFGSLPALSGALAVAGFGSVLGQAFEARFYAPWLMLTALHISSLARLVERPGSVPRQAQACLTAALLCWVHYFGVITLVLTGIGVAWSLRSRWRRSLTLIPAAAFGIVALAVLTPMLVGQKSALSVPTWVPPPSLSQLWTFMRSLLLPKHFAILVLLVGGSLLFRRGGTPGWATARAASSDAAAGGLLALGLLPPILVLFSLLVQPAMIDRYALPATLAFAPIAAFLTARVRRPVQILVLVGFVAWIQVRAGAEAKIKANYAAVVNENVQIAKEMLGLGEMLVVPTRLGLYPILPSLAADEAAALRMPILDERLVHGRFPAASDSAHLGRLILLEQDIGNVHHAMFGIPGVISLAELAGASCVLVLERGDRPDFASRWLPQGNVVRLRPRLFRIDNGPASRTSPGAGCAERQP